MDKVKEKEWYSDPYSDSDEDEDTDVEATPEQSINRNVLDMDAYMPQLEANSASCSQSFAPLGKILGIWNGYLYDNRDDTCSIAGMISLSLRPATTGGQDLNFEGEGWSNGDKFIVSGTCIEGGSADNFQVISQRSFDAYSIRYHCGSLSLDDSAFTGTFGDFEDPNEQDKYFAFRRTPPISMQFRPLEPAFQANKSLALWSFATAAVRYQIQQRMCSKSFLQQRTTHRRRFLELQIREEGWNKALNGAESAELARIRHKMTSMDSRFYHSLVTYKIRRMVNHS